MRHKKLTEMKIYIHKQNKIEGKHFFLLHKTHNSLKTDQILKAIKLRKSNCESVIYCQQHKAFKAINITICKELYKTMWTTHVYT